MQISLGLPDPRQQSALTNLQRVQAGICRAQMLRRSPPRTQLPITASVLLQIKATLQAACDQDKVLIWAVTCTAFFVFVRLGELLLETTTQFRPTVHLAWGDVAVDNQASPSMIRVTLKRSKCDQFERGVDIIMGHTGQELCPVAAL